MVQIPCSKDSHTMGSDSNASEGKKFAEKARFYQYLCHLCQDVCQVPLHLCCICPLQGRSRQIPASVLAVPVRFSRQFCVVEPRFSAWDDAALFASGTMKTDCKDLTLLTAQYSLSAAQDTRHGTADKRAMAGENFTARIWRSKCI